MSGSTAVPQDETSRDGAVPSIAAPALRGSVWTLGGYAAGQLVRLGGNVVLARLLFPAVFGQMALVFVFVSGLQMFSDVGTGPAIVQSARGDDERFLRTAWTIQCARGIALWATSWVIAWPVAAFYELPSLRWLIPAAAANAAVSGFESTAMHGMQRHLRLERLTIVEVASQVLGLAVTVLLAAASRRLHGAEDPRAVWAMIAGSLVSSVTRLALSHGYLPGIRHRFLLDRECLAQLFGFGRWIFVSTVLTFFALQSDRLVFGKMVPIALLGVYSIGATLAALPTEAAAKLGTAVVFPAYSRLAATGELQARFGRVRMPLVIAGAAVVTALAAAGPSLVRVLYDERYAQAGWIIRYLSVAAWLRILSATSESALLATRRVEWMAAGNAAKALALLVAVPLGFAAAGFEGALVAVVASELFKYAATAAGVARAGLPVLRADALLTGGVMGAALAASAAGAAAGAGSGHELVALFASGAAACVLWGPVALRYLGRGREARAAPLANG